MKRYLIGFIVLTISIFVIGIDKVSALSNNEFEVVYKTNTRILKKPAYYGYKYGIVFYISNTGFTYFLSNEPLAYSTTYVVVNKYDNYNFEFKENDNAFSTHELTKFKTFTNSYGINTSDRPIVWSNYDIPEVQVDLNDDGSVNYYYSTGNIAFYCNSEECINSNSKFDEIISTNIYSFLEFTFTLPTSSTICTRFEGLQEIEYECPLLELNYDIYNSDKNGNFNTMSFGIPHLIKKYLYDTGSSNVTKTDTIPLSDITSNKYTGNYTLDFDVNVTNLKLVIPFEHLKYSFVHISLDSSIPFEVKYIEKSSVEEYYSTVDITGKAGVMFIPKQIDEDMLMGFKFQETNTYSLQLRDTYKEDFKVLTYYSIGYCDDREYNDNIPVICNSGSGGYQTYINFKKGNLEQSVFVINRSYPNKDKSLVSYDSRYFMPVIYDHPYSKPTFLHPITGEEITLGNLLDFDSSLDKVTNESFFKQVSNAFNHFKQGIVVILQDISYFFSNLNVTLKYFFMVIFSITLFTFFIRFIL